MKNFHRILSRFGLLLVLSLIVAACSTPPESEEAPSANQEPVVKYGVTVRSGPMDEVLLKDYAPQVSLKVPESHLPKAKMGAIDVHTHVYAKNPEELDAWVATMDAVGIDVTVVLTSATGERFDELAELYLTRYPDRFQLYCGIDTENIEDPGYAERVAAELARCYEKGARGVGEASDKGWGFGGRSDTALPMDKRLHPDDARLDLFWEKCAELKIPVNLHIADHPSCWQPLGPNWERTPDFQGFNLHGKEVPSFEELMTKRDNVLTKHPNTIFIACHFSNLGHDLATLSEVLDKYPNLYLDISARDYEIGRQPRAAAAFMERYADRLLFGTDMGREQHMYEAWWRILETGDEFIPGRLWWRLYGLELSDEVLKPLYQDNARRLLNWTPAG